MVGLIRAEKTPNVRIFQEVTSAKTKVFCREEAAATINTTEVRIAVKNRRILVEKYLRRKCLVES